MFALAYAFWTLFIILVVTSKPSNMDLHEAGTQNSATYILAWIAFGVNPHIFN